MNCVSNRILLSFIVFLRFKSGSALVWDGTDESMISRVLSRHLTSGENKVQSSPNHFNFGELATSWDLPICPDRHELRVLVDGGGARRGPIGMHTAQSRQVKKP
ncbi:uncharacterized protein B0H64DRAFT_152404 [Chaetomium fimeti]|uniref:Secreted protein n=1 Tax=Chaetomium fimeti TaxID=1854472 RepID=A0AAE0LSD0_9PEZI|nr:hypothetical protein B0H64DRAFT_152404 [Chaetomium fimeti]